MTMNAMKSLAAAALLIAGALHAHAVPLRTLQDLNSVTVWEATFSTTANTFAANSSALTTRLGDPLSSSNRDFSYYPEEYYDVFYSNADGAPNPDGAFITIEGVWRTYLGLGSMNIAEVQLDFGGATPHADYADFVSSYVYGSYLVGGPGQFTSGSEALAVDQNLNTFPRFGNTSNTDLNERFRLTVGFNNFSTTTAAVPEAGSLGWMCLAGMTFFGIARLRLGRHPKCSALGPIDRLGSSSN